jgi:mRNA interferase MazF
MGYRPRRRQGGRALIRKAKHYVPECGDIVWIHLDPQAGREQGGHRTCLVLSPALYNGKTALAVLCPITKQTKGYPFEVPLPAGAECATA